MREKLRKSLLLLPAVSLVMTGCQGTETAEKEEVLESVEGTETIAVENEELVPEESSDGVVSLTIWGAEDDQALVEQIIQSFEAEYAGEAEFDITFAAESESSCRDSLLNNVLEAPDVFTFADDQLMAFAAAGVLKPVEGSEEIASRNLETSVDAASIDGELYAYPLTADNGYFMYYNKAYFSEEDVQSLDTMLAIASENGKKITMDITSGWYLYSFFGNTGMEVGLKEDGISNYCTWNATEGNVKGVDVASSMLSIAQNPGFLCTGDDGFMAGVQDGSVIAGVSGVWNATEISEAWGEDYGAAKLPSYACNGTQVQMSSYAGYKLVGVNDYSKHKEWAAKFADWMTNEENQMLRFEMRGQGPANTNAAGSPEVAASPAIQAIIAQAEFASLQRIGTKYWGPAGTYGSTIAAGNPSNLELQDMMDTLVDGITESNAQ
ncbi:MAG: extracellular solute-binding protein [Roseburia sp.]